MGNRRQQQQGAKAPATDRAPETTEKPVGQQVLAGVPNDGGSSTDSGGGIPQQSDAPESGETPGSTVETTMLQGQDETPPSGETPLEDDPLEDSVPERVRGTDLAALFTPGVKARLRAILGTELAKAERDERDGPGGSGWTYNESKREEVGEWAAFLRTAAADWAAAEDFPRE